MIRVISRNGRIRIDEKKQTKRELPLAFFGLARLGVLLGLFCLGSVARAQSTFTWTGLDPFWFDPNNWTPIGPPGSADIAQFNTSLFPPPILFLSGTTQVGEIDFTLERWLSPLI